MTLVIIDEAKKTFSEDNEDPSVIIEMIERLDKELSPIVTKEILSTTHIGREVGKLKSHTNQEIANNARTLIEKWKILIKGSRDQRDNDEERRKEEKNPLSSEPTAPTDEQKKEDEDSSSRKRPLEEEQQAINSVTTTSVYEGEFVSKNDKRNRCREILFKAFVEGFANDQLYMVDKLQLEYLVAQIESSLWDHYVVKNNSQGDYTAQLRSIK